MRSITAIKKRDGRVVPFESSKIDAAIQKALAATSTKDGRRAKALAKQVVAVLEAQFSGRVPSVEDVQDAVEQTLIKNGFASTAKAYILYRQRRMEEREAKRLLGVRDELKLSVNAMRVLERRYLLRDDERRVVETPAQLFRRVAKALAAADANAAKSEDEFYQMMARLDFMPNTPCLMNAGARLGQLAACYVVGMQDTLESILNALHLTAMLQQGAAGTGFNFSHLRPRGDVIGSTKGTTPGPVTFIKLFDMLTDVMKQGGKRRGANMGILNAEHPDILEFITAKSDMRSLGNFNISVAVTDGFMKKAERGEDYDLVNPRTKKAVRRINAADVFSLIVTNAWLTGDPGLVFIDEINRRNPTPLAGRIESTNPCGEVPLLPYENCMLGSINLANFVKDGELDYGRLRGTVRSAVRFLDNAITVNKYTDERFRDMAMANRKIGLGVMGFADALVQMGVPYDSGEAVRIAEQLAQFIEQEGHRMSQEIAAERGNFKNFGGSIWQKKGYKGMRNATVTTIAPTGTISVITDCSSGIEPLFAVVFVRNVMEGTKLLEANGHFERVARERGFYSRELMAAIAKSGSVQGMREVPKDVQRVFVTALDIAPEWHVRMQAAFQKHVDNAVSKTINFPANATVEDVRRAYLLAWKLKCKGITIYRYGSKPEQVLYTGPVASAEMQVAQREFASADVEYSGGCPYPGCAV